MKSENNFNTFIINPLNKKIMKKIFTLLSICFFVSALSAQTIPNAGFEQWTSETEATGWASNFSMPLMDMFTIDYASAEKSSNSHTGFAMGLHAVPISLDISSLPIPIPGMGSLYTLPGIAHLGTFNLGFDLESLMTGMLGGGGSINASSFIEGMVQGGIACNRVPQSVKAWIRYVPANADDAMSITVRCYSNGEKVAEGVYNQTTASNSFTQITIPVTATSNTTPDQLNIILNCGNQEGTYLHVDDIELVMDGGGTDPEEPEAIEEPINVIFSAYPNPTHDLITITPTVAGSYQAIMFDMNGREVWAGQSLQGATKVDVSTLSEGVYFLKVTANGLTRTEKVLVK